MFYINSCTHNKVKTRVLLKVHTKYVCSNSLSLLSPYSQRDGGAMLSLPDGGTLGWLDWDGMGWSWSSTIDKMAVWLLHAAHLTVYSAQCSYDTLLCWWWNACLSINSWLMTSGLRKERKCWLPRRSAFSQLGASFSALFDDMETWRGRATLSSTWPDRD